jgi:hypothetical protein
VIWRECFEFPDYEVSEYGDVRRCRQDGRGKKFGRVLRKKVDNNYSRITLYRDGVRVTVKISRLVAKTFISPSPFDGAHVCHKDGYKLNDHYSNLRWDTINGNMADKVLHGTDNRGVKNYFAKLCESEVSEIKFLLARGVKQLEIAAQFNTTQMNVSKIATGRSWKFVAPAPAEYQRRNFGKLD